METRSLAILYVASDRPRAGKTTVCASLAKLLEQRGKKAVVFKPVPISDDIDPDILTYQDLLGCSQYDRDFDRSTDIEAGIYQLAERNDVVIIEGLSDTPAQDAANLINTVDAKTIIVSRFSPELNVQDLSEFSIQFSNRLIGVVINGLTRYQGTAYKTTLATGMEARGLVMLGAIPEDRRLLGVTVGDLAAHLDGKYLTGSEYRDGLVEHVMVGGLGLDSGEAYFGLRHNKAVVIRGDRPDIQMAALATPTTCVVLANGIDPIEYVLAEAELEKVPLISVKSDTLDTMELMNGLYEHSNFNHPAKLERSVKLLQEHIDTKEVYSALELAQ